MTNLSRPEAEGFEDSAEVDSEDVGFEADHYALAVEVDLFADWVADVESVGGVDLGGEAGVGGRWVGEWIGGQGFVVIRWDDEDVEPSGLADLIGYCGWELNAVALGLGDISHLHLGS
jgi:hypothetical protein